mmetsp:Transcript_35520/g.102115  ORF Transcript_35520/g.102115 Transcript_35520/m.102115 type:complete len:203 (+) Transcript_35520:636-1244(+)
MPQPIQAQVCQRRLGPGQGRGTCKHTLDDLVQLQYAEDTQAAARFFTVHARGCRLGSLQRQPGNRKGALSPISLEFPRIALCTDTHLQDVTSPQQGSKWLRDTTQAAQVENNGHVCGGKLQSSHRPLGNATLEGGEPLRVEPKSHRPFATLCCPCAPVQAHVGRNSGIGAGSIVEQTLLKQSASLLALRLSHNIQLPTFKTQ